MGIFSSESVYSAFSQTQPLIADEDKQDTLLTFAASAFRHEDENLVPNLIAAFKAGLPGTAYTYLTYGRNDYYWGLPESNYQSFNLSENDILDVIGHDKFIKTTYLPVGGAFIGAVHYLNDQSWYDINEKEVTLPIEIGGDYGYADPFDFEVEASKSRLGYIKITFPITWKVPTTPFHPETYSVETYSWHARSKAYDNALWIIYGKKSELSNPEPPGWDQNLVWPPSYQFDSYYPSSAFPTDPLDIEPTEFYPISVFRRDYDDYTSSGEWKTTLRKLTRKLNIDADDVYEEFQNAIRNSQANKAELVDFSIGFFIQIYGDVTPDGWKTPHQKYVFEFIANLSQGQNPNLGRKAYEDYLDELDDWENGTSDTETDPDDEYSPVISRKPTPPQQGMYVAEADGNGFNYRFSFSFIEKYTSYISHADAESKFDLFEVDWTNGHYGQWIRGVEHLSGNSTLYTSYMLVNAEAQYIVNTPDGARSARPEQGVWCPISYDLLKRLPFRDQDAVLQDGMCGVVYTVIEQEINWYQGTFWSGVIIIITFIITIWIGGVGVQGVLGALGLGVISGVALYLATMVISFALGSLLSLSGALLGLGPRGQMFLKVVKVLLMSNPTGMSTSAFSSYFADIWLNVGDFSLDALVALTSKVGQLYQTGRMILSAFNEPEDPLDTVNYTQSLQDQREEVEEAYLGTPSRKIVDPHLELSRRLDTNIFETPDQYMARTTMVNPGAQVLSVPANYVDMALQLPSTIGTGVTVGVSV